MADAKKSTSKASRKISKLFSGKKKPRDCSPPTTPRLLTFPHDPAVEFIQNRVTLMDPERIGYNHEERHFTTVDKAPNHPLLTEIPLGFTQDASIKHRRALYAHFKFQAEILTAAESAFTDVKCPTGEEDEMWKDVIATIEEAADNYKNVGRARKALRKLGDNASALQQYTKLLPESVFTSSLIGGITLVLRAAETVSSLRDDVLTWLAEVPDRIRATSGSGLVSLYKKDPNGASFSDGLHDISGRLYEAILEAITLMLQWLETKSKKKYLRALLKGPDQYPKAIEDSIARIDNLGKLLSAEAENCLHHAIDGIKTQQVDNHRENQAKFDKLDNKTELCINLINHLLELCRESQKSDESTHRLPVRRSMKKQFEEQLLRAIKAEDASKIAAEDRESYFRGAVAANPEEKDRVNWILASPKLQAWFVSKDHHVLVVNGNIEDSDRQDSPLSYLCAFLCNAFQTQMGGAPHAVVYCKNNTLTGLSGVDILRSFIAQLLAKFDIDLFFLEGQIPSKKGLRKPKELGELLGRLLDALGNGKPLTLFWLIDGLSRYETPDTAKKTRIAMKELENVILGCKKNVVIKLLVTYPTRRTFRSYEFHKIGNIDLLNVPAEIDGVELDRYIDRRKLFSG